ncbi:MAG: GFA family protein [Pseudomonadota bacterium]
MQIEGRCYCGAVAYEAVGEPFIRAQCHCRECQYMTGGHPLVALGMPRQGFVYTKGSPATFQRTDIDNATVREFCPHCGTHLVSKPANMPTGVLIRVGTLDDPTVFGKPELAIYTGDAQSFHSVPADIPYFDKVPPAK